MDGDDRNAEISGFLEALRAERGLGEAVRHHEILPERPPEFGERDPGPLAPVLERRGISALYSHQARALGLLDEGRDVVLSTPTASGKSLVYNLPALDAALQDPESRALYLFPLRALEQDQHKKLEADIASLGLGDKAPRVAIYDGDTPTSRRRKLRDDPPHVLITTPDMLHLGILPHHESWKRFFAGLRLVVLDELHTYRGIFGSQVAQVLRRLDRIARHHGGRPRFVATSATVANPGELAESLTGRRFAVVQKDGAPRTRRHVVLLNPGGSSYTAASRLFRLAVGRGLRTIAFTKARTITELMYTWISEAEPELRARISAYRAGFLPEERREIESRLFRGDLLGVISTSALEMGIDVGGLDVCILVGYPGSQIATWQRGGRVGRSRDAVISMVAQPDALDQFLVAHPRVFFERRFEHAVLDAHNPEIAAAHLPCAAAELPLRHDEPWLESDRTRRVVADLEETGSLLRSENGGEWFAVRRRPHREVDLRSAGGSWTIVEEPRGSDAKPRVIGSIGSGRVLAECHEGAIYLHRGRQFLVTELDWEERTVRTRAVQAPYYTRAISEKETEILERTRERPSGNFRLVEGRVKVTTLITGYERRRVRGQDLISSEKLELPPSHMETTGIWLEIPDEIGIALRSRERHPMGSIHAIEHAALALVPLFALCDRFDVAGISYLRHPQLGRSAVFLYDGHAGGLGLMASVFDRIEALLESTLALIRDCPCETGCPACVHSPKCGNGNRPMDKVGATEALELLLGQADLPALPEPAAAAAEPQQEVAESGCPAPEVPAARADAPDVVFFDLETQRSAQEVGGWHNSHLMRVALAVVYDSRRDHFETFTERDVPALLRRLRAADLVVGFNVRRFDYKVLSGYGAVDPDSIATFDLLDAVHARLGFRLSLAHLGEETVGASKSADGLQSLRWWKEGRVDEIEAYCRQDVALLRQLYEHAETHGHLIFRTRSGERVRLPLAVDTATLIEAAREAGGAAPRPSRV